PTFLDPGLLTARPVVDAAKLISRIFLGLIAIRPGRKTIRAVADGVNAFAETIIPPRAITADLWMRELMTFWLMDTVNITTTYLSAPTTLPLPSQGLALIENTGHVCAVTERVSWALSCGRKPRAVWDLALRQVIEVAS
ncbi:phosphotransferase, partial [Streptomyces xanthochromogenes]